ncbi:MAG: TonB-dependent receptor [Bacteroides sp.]
MKKNNLLIALTLISSGTAWAENLPKDTLKVIDIEEVVVIASPKETRKLRQQPAAVSLLSQKEMQANQVTSLKSLTSVVPNLFIPDYGSKLTSAIYIRGIGSRINTPSVGLYVDNVPYIDKSAFDFNYSDIERIDVLRGPQGTLYGRNTMGGLIKVHTKSPFTYQGTDLRLGAGTYNNYNASLTHYHRTSDQFAFSTGGFYEHAGGFFGNAAKDNKKMDRIQAGGGRFRGIYLPTANLKLDLTLSYEYSDQGGYAYGMLNRKTNTYTDPACNDESSYHRSLLNGGLNLEYQGKHFVMSSVTGFQYLKDGMFIDQDFSPADTYTLAQKQHQKTLTEEVTFKSRGTGHRWDWVAGASAFYQWLATDAPVTFKKDGIGMIQAMMDKSMAGSPVKIKLTDETMPVPGLFDTPTMGAAAFHQSTINHLLVDGLSATIGLRLDYEKIKIDYNSSAVMNYTMMGIAGARTAEFIGKANTDYLQLLPKFALKYDFDQRNNVYASVSRGYRSGGYNIQMFSDLISGQLMQKPGSAMPTPEEVAATIAYKPEYSWNYEAGSHLTLCQGKLWADLAAFYMDTRDQQVAQFAKSGLGRTTVNAGKSRSYGVEASLRANLTDALSINANYGYTNATFTDYVIRQQDAQGNLTEKANYNGNYVPFVPKHTFSVGAQYLFLIAPRHWLDRVQVNANYNAAGRIYWTEANNVSQAFYGTLNGRLSFEKGNGAIAFWVRNALDKNYQAFYFESMGNGFQQKGRPVQLGVDIRCRF